MECFGGWEKGELGEARGGGGPVGGGQHGTRGGGHGRGRARQGRVGGGGGRARKGRAGQGRGGLAFNQTKIQFFLKNIFIIEHIKKTIIFLKIKKKINK